VSAHLLPELGSAAPCVILAHRVPQSAALSEYARRSPSELLLPAQAARQALDEFAPTLTRGARDKAVAVIGGRAAVLAGLRAVSTATGRGLEPILDRVTSWEELLARLAQALLANADGEARGALALATEIEYALLDGTSVLVAESRLPAGPWLQYLEDGWVRVRACWQKPLQSLLGRRAEPGRDTLHDAAEWLIQVGGNDRAISILLEIGDTDCAARVIASHATTLMDLGQWVTLESWLQRLPDKALAPYPGLIYCKADLAAARGRATAAQRWFGIAASHCSKRNDIEGTCRSMLAASVTAAAHGHISAALSQAYAVESLAEGSDLTAIRMWASWHQGRLQLLAGNTESALASFCRAASAVSTSGETAAAQPIQLAGNLAMRVGELRRQQKSHREAQAALDQAEHLALNQLLTHVEMHAWESEDVLGAYGWSGAPAPLKLPGLTPRKHAPARQAGQLTRLRRAILPNRKEDSARRTPLDNPGGDHVATAAVSQPDSLYPYLPAFIAPVTVAERAAVLDPPHKPQPPGMPGTPVAPRAPGISGRSAMTQPHVPLVLSQVAKRPDASAQLAVHLLGPLCAAVDEVPVEHWPSPRCRSLFAYLLTHRKPWPAREVLMEVFWPESPPEASRNSLNVAIHGLRQTLRTATVLPVILHTGGAYRIHPRLRLWLDVEEFGKRVEEGRRLEEAGEPERAAREYEFVASLYRGDFLADGLYEDWAALTRERLRLTHLEALSRLSNLQFNAGRYAACAALCQRIIERDPCREDAHRRLMRSYSRQGQPHLALMQYRACVRALAGELGVDADPATTKLHDQIRRHEPV
jgi:DNA-binding SARP family transcriptional activator